MTTTYASDIDRGDRPRLRAAVASARALCTVRARRTTASSDEVESQVRSALTGYRRLLEQSWSIETIHPAYTSQFGVGDPVGQCGASSAWLLGQLREDQNLVGCYCYGSLTIGGPTAGTIARHCWVETTIDNTMYVIDLTADQAPGIDDAVVFDRKDHLRKQRKLSYQARITKNLDDLREDAVWSRLLVLSHLVAGARENAAR